MIHGQKGFTLIEAVVATAVFAFVIASIFGVYNSTLQLDRKSKSQRAVAQNSRFIMEYLGKEIRNGTIYYAGYPGGIADETLILANQANEIESFYLTGTDLQLEKNSETTNLNSAGVQVTNLEFYIEPDGEPYVLGSSFNEQPHVTVIMELTSDYGVGSSTSETINLQSTFATRNYPSRVVGGAAPGVCEDVGATNFGGALPCLYPPPDTEDPVVVITAPTAGAFVSGNSVTVSATASDNVGVLGVQFRLDGANLGSEDLSAPYSITWDSTTASNGLHSLTAVARDAADNSTTSSAISVTVDNIAPVVTVFDVQPRTTAGSVTATFTATDSGTSHLGNAELWRAVYNAINCTATVITGCTWSMVDTVDGNDLDSWSDSMNDTPPSGSTYVYGVHVYDNANNFGLEPARIEVVASVVCTAGSQVFSYTGSNQTFTVPAGCTSVTIKAWGAGGGGSSQGYTYPYVTAGGGGGYATGTLTVTPGQQLTVIVGQGAGGVGNNGFTPFGGGRSAVRLLAGTEILTAAGGGGGGYGINAMVSAGGGGATGAEPMAGSTLDGGGGTQSAGGVGGVGDSGSGAAGSQYQGGASPYGGGGGGYFGGGGGGISSGICSCGGGGGSSYVGGVTGGSTTAGSGATPGNTGDAWYVAGIGVGGPIGSISDWIAGGTGGNGRIVITW